MLRDDIEKHGVCFFSKIYQVGVVGHPVNIYATARTNKSSLDDFLDNVARETNNKTTIEDILFQVERNHVIISDCSEEIQTLSGERLVDGDYMISLHLKIVESLRISRTLH